MTGESKILAILAEQAGADTVLRHAAKAPRASPHASIATLHVRVDPISTIMPTAKCFPTSRHGRSNWGVSGKAPYSVLPSKAGPPAAACCPPGRMSWARSMVR